MGSQSGNTIGISLPEEEGDLYQCPVCGYGSRVSSTTIPPGISFTVNAENVERGLEDVKGLCPHCLFWWFSKYVPKLEKVKK
jgi:hypothetical protein